MNIRRSLIAALALAFLAGPLAGARAQSQVDKTGSGGVSAGQETEVFTTPIIVGAAVVAVAVGVIVATANTDNNQSSSSISTATSTTTR